jgi:GTP-binding protein EngB required for normal cell division
MRVEMAIGPESGEQSGLLETVIGLCERVAAASQPGTARDGALQVAARLREPLRVAVAGRVSAGKSTLVNALLGVAVAPTSAGECTRVVTWYRFGDHDQAVALLRDGSRSPVTLGPARTLPEQLPVPWEDVESLEVSLYCSPLRDITLIDTPGVSSLAEQTPGARITNLLTARSRRAAREADAIAYVLTRQVREDDQRVLEAFVEETYALRTSAANTVVLMNKADKLDGQGEDPAAVCARLLQRARSQLGPAVAAVFPTVGLLAETSACGLLDESAARSVRALANLPPDEQRAMFRRTRAAAPADGATSGSRADRDRLMRLLDAYGLRRCLDAAAEGRGGAGELTRVCGQLSGISELRAFLFEHFSGRAGVLKADSALDALRALMHGATPAERRLLTNALQDGAEELALAPEGNDLRVIALARELASGRLSLPPDRQDDVARWLSAVQASQRLGLGAGGVIDVRSAALALASRWRAYGNDPRHDAGQRHAAHVMTAAYASLIQASSI